MPINISQFTSLVLAASLLLSGWSVYAADVDCNPLVESTFEIVVDELANDADSESNFYSNHLFFDKSVNYLVIPNSAEVEFNYASGLGRLRSPPSLIAIS